MRKVQIILFALLISFTSCEYGEIFAFRVNNNSSKTIVVETLRFYNSFHSTDTIHIIKEGESKEIAFEKGGISAYWEYPESIYKDGDIIPRPDYKFDIYVDSILIPELKFYEYWTYKTEKYYNGTYELVVTDELLEKISQKE